jgi:organic radical activating enzyme
MGEPLMYEHFQTVLNLCEQHGVKLNLTTNGTFPKKGPVWWAHQLLPVSSDIKISWSGATKSVMEEVMRGSNWEKRVADLDKFLEVIIDQFLNLHFAHNPIHHCEHNHYRKFL